MVIALFGDGSAAGVLDFPGVGEITGDIIHIGTGALATHLIGEDIMILSGVAITDILIGDGTDIMVTITDLFTEEAVQTEEVSIATTQEA